MDDIEKIKYFKAVAETGSFLSASKKVYKTQQSVFYAVKKLEESLNTSLFKRSNKGTLLTNQGKQLLKFSNQLDKLAFEFEKTLYGKVRSLSLAIQSPAIPIVAPFLNNYLDSYPELNLNLMAITTTSKTIKAVEEGAADIAIVGHQKLKNKKLVQIPIWDEYYACFKGTNWNINTKNLDINQLNKYKLLYYEEAHTGSGSSLGKYLNHLGLNNSDIHLDSFEAVLSIIKNCKFIGVLPQVTFTKALKAKEIERVNVKKHLRKIGVFSVNIVCSQDETIIMMAKKLKQLILQGKPFEV